VKQSAPNLDPPETKPGPKPSSININLAVAIYVSGITVEKALVLFAEAGVVALVTRKNLEDMLEKVKGAAQYLSEGNLYENQKEHIKACRETVGYKAISNGLTIMA
jgi:ribosomal protein S13